MRYLVLTLLLPVLCGFIAISANATERLSTQEADSPEYLLNHGHSPEVVRMIQVQERRTIGKETKSSNRLVKFMKNLYHERDFTLSLTDFGQSPVSSAEAPLDNSMPKVIKRNKPDKLFDW